MVKLTSTLMKDLGKGERLRHPEELGTYKGHLVRISGTSIGIVLPAVMRRKYGADRGDEVIVTIVPRGAS